MPAWGVCHAHLVAARTCASCNSQSLPTAKNTRSVLGSLRCRWPARRCWLTPAPAAACLQIAWETKAEDVLLLHVAPVVYWTR